MKTHRTLVVLSCLHTAVFDAPAPAVGERVYCFRCGAYRDAMEAPPDYSVRCESCQYGKHCGNALITAETAATKHSLARPGHRVQLRNGTQTVTVYEHAPLPANIEPPF